MPIIEKTRRLLRRQYSKGQLLWFRFAWNNVKNFVQFLKNFVHFNPIFRFYYFQKYVYLIIFKRHQPLELNKKIMNGVFYICVLKKDNQTFVVKIPHLNRRYSYSLWKKIRSQKAYNDYENTLKSISKDSFFGQHVPCVKKVERHGGYCSSYIPGYNLIIVRDILRDGKDLPQNVVRLELMHAIDELLTSLKKYEHNHGHLIGDWALNNLIYDPFSKRIYNVDLEGFYVYQEGQLQTNMQYVEAILNYLRTMLEMCGRQNFDDKNILKILSLLESIKKSNVAYSGDDYPAGYHSLTLRKRYFRGQRECTSRLDTIPYDFTNKVVLDLGCNCGGMLHALADKIQTGVGVDVDFNCVNTANSIKALNGSNNLHFYAVDLDKDDLNIIDNFILEKQVDICFLLSICMWILNWKKVIEYVSQRADTLLFESNGNDSQQKEQIDFLNTCFSEVYLVNPKSYDDQNTSRALYLCKKRNI